MNVSTFFDLGTPTKQYLKEYLDFIKKHERKSYEYCTNQTYH